MARSRKRNETFEPESRWSRVIWIDRQIRDGQPPGVEEIMEQFGVKKNTVDATIRFMRDSLGAPIVHKRLPRPHYCYTDSTYALPTVFLVEGELLALLLSEQILHHYVGTPLEAGLKSAVSKLTRYLPDTIKLRMQDVSDTIRFTGLPPRDVSLEVLNALSRAINERCLVRILYHTFSTDEMNWRNIEPHLLVHTQSGWQLVAWDHLRGADRNFVLSRIRDYQILDTTFEPRPALAAETYTRHGLFAEQGSEPIRVSLKFDAHQARYMRERKWHESQQIEELADGGIIMTLEVAGRGDVLRWVLGYGHHVQVLEPDWLRHEVREEIRSAAAAYEASSYPS